MPKAKKTDALKADNQPSVEQTMFPPIGSDEPAPNMDDGEEFLPGYKTKDDALKALQTLQSERDKYAADIEAMRRSQEQLQGMLDQLMAGIAPGKPSDNDDPPRPVSVDISKIPDPIEDREGFTKSLLNVVQQLVQTNVQTVAQQTSKASKLDKLWIEFTEEYEDLADYPELIEASVREVVGEYKARGIDPERLMFGNKDRFFSLVADRTNKRLEKLKKRFGLKDEGVDDLSDGPREPVRDVGLFGTSRGQPTHDTKGNEKLGSLIGDLQKLQRTSGFF